MISDGRMPVNAITRHRTLALDPPGRDWPSSAGAPSSDIAARMPRTIS